MDVSTDSAHCGDCNKACADGESCVEGACKAACLEGHTPCADVCVDLGNDPKNCGDCGKACGDGELCVEGKCAKDCPPGQDVCLGVCVDTGSDVEHCGGCEQACADTELCVESKCVCPMGQDSCNAVCVDLGVDVANCGMCDNACTAPAQAAATCEKNMCGWSCNMGFENCNMKADDGCEANLATDVLNCSGCGKSCGTVANGTPGCNNSACVIASCDKGYEDCDMKPSSGCEVNLTNDDNNCGKCGLPCAITHYCSGSTCLLKPTCGNPNGGSLSKDNGTAKNVLYCYNSGDSTETRAKKACESHFGEGKCCIITGGYDGQQYGECGKGGGTGTTHWHYAPHPVGHCAPTYKTGDVMSIGWCGTILGNFL